MSEAEKLPDPAPEEDCDEDDRADYDDRDYYDREIGT